MARQGILYIIAAPSGGGKTSLIKALIKEVNDIYISVSHTTRSRRETEVEGVDYFYISRDKFESLLKQDIFLEHALVFGNYYGTSRAWVEETLKQGKDVILEIDWQGAQQVCALMPKAVTVFVLPPSRQLLKQRLLARNEDAASTIQVRLSESVNEMSHYREYDYLIINDIFDSALQDLKTIILSHRLKRESQEVVYADVIRDLLES